MDATRRAADADAHRHARRDHLATALLWQHYAKTPLVFATHDAELALAAHAHGFAVVGAAI